ncbi:MULTISPECIES: hypothetical protein [Bacteroides]|jgi:hypothetical protein|uniref:Uncharacterized protein n=1 Tax=Bacteroides fragilis TaxID=817 RepID=A0A0I9SAS9_BACFG|nr:hypothetical protein [Bacteroides fragilis]DAZ13164.1 MAG TPA: hypothetical protein [Caudoviricetes sp.]MCM0197264.1 hypothetical protein [Bacteroides fragilis]MCM0198151.1 hypothetical protein [Bacteroides fragilis]MCM0208502.1 hypothetical protein [Bacteroides fragilis]MCM0213033.1 hypothetical protein [Bacteroides fragilis]
MIFKGRTLNPIQSEYVGLNDIVSINGIIGWLDFIGEDMIAVVDEKEILHKIATEEIHSVVKYTNFINGNMTNIPIRSLIKAA